MLDQGHLEGCGDVLEDPFLYEGFGERGIGEYIVVGELEAFYRCSRKVR